MRVRHQIGVLSPIASAFLVPDNHIGRATVSSIAVAHEVARMGGRAIACLNARDRNVLGFRRDLLTAAAYGVDELLFVYGDRPEIGPAFGRPHRADDDRRSPGFDGERHRWRRLQDRRHLTTAARSHRGKARPTSSWLRSATTSGQLVAWRESIDVPCPVYAGVMVVASAGMARKLTTTIPQLAVPTGVVEFDRGRLRGRHRHRLRARPVDSGDERLRRRAPHPARSLSRGR